MYETLIIILLPVPASVPLEQHLRNLDPLGLYSVPNVSSCQPINLQNFTQSTLQPSGCDNDSNACCLISVVICMHRMCLVNFFIDMQNDANPDLPNLLLAKILRAMPSPQSFSLHTFVDTWNASIQGIGTQLGQNEDLYIAEHLFSSLRFQVQGLTPILTQYRAKFYCPQCCTNYSGITDGIHRSFQTIPELKMPDRVDIDGASPGLLMTNLLNETFVVTCRMCNNQIRNASFDVVKGRFTIIRIARITFENGTAMKNLNDLDCRGDSSPGGQLLGDLIAVISHIGGPEGGHWVAYSKVSNGWFLNDDSQQVIPSSPFNPSQGLETINMLCYQN